MKDWEFPDQLSDCQLLNNNFIPRNKLITAVITTKEQQQCFRDSQRKNCVIHDKINP
jgi:hypothetical protein